MRYKDTPELREKVIRAWNKGIKIGSMGKLSICPAYLSKKILFESGIDITRKPSSKKTDKDQ